MLLDSFDLGLIFFTKHYNLQVFLINTTLSESYGKPTIFKESNSFSLAIKNIKSNLWIYQDT